MQASAPQMPVFTGSERNCRLVAGPDDGPLPRGEVSAARLRPASPHTLAFPHHVRCNAQPVPCRAVPRTHARRLPFGAASCCLAGVPSELAPSVMALRHLLPRPGLPSPVPVWSRATAHRVGGQPHALPDCWQRCSGRRRQRLRGMCLPSSTLPRARRPCTRHPAKRPLPPAPRVNGSQRPHRARRCGPPWLRPARRTAWPCPAPPARRLTPVRG